MIIALWLNIPIWYVQNDTYIVYYIVFTQIIGRSYPQLWCNIRQVISLLQQEQLKCTNAAVCASQNRTHGVQYLPNSSLVMLKALGSRVPGPHNQQESIEGVGKSQGNVILLLFAGLHGNTPHLVIPLVAHKRNIWQRHEDSFNAEKLEVGSSFPAALQQLDRSLSGTWRQFDSNVTANWQEHDSNLTTKWQQTDRKMTAVQQLSEAFQFCAPICMSTQTKRLFQHSLCSLHDIQPNEVHQHI